MPIEGVLDLGKDIEDPAKFVLDERVEFLHRFKRYANLLRTGNMSPRQELAFSRSFAGDLNNYRLILTCFQFRLHGEAEGLLSVLLAYMDMAWEDRATLGRGMAHVADEIAVAYTNLADYLKSETAEH